MTHLPHTTSTGIRIGGAYVPPPARMGSEAEAIRAVLLARRYGGDRRPDPAAMAAAVFAAAVIAFILLTVV